MNVHVWTHVYIHMHIHVHIFPCWLIFELSENHSSWNYRMGRLVFILKEAQEKRTIICLCQQLSDEPVSHVSQYNHRKSTSHMALTCNCTIKVNLSFFPMFRIHFNYLSSKICIFCVYGVHKHRYVHTRYMHVFLWVRKYVQTCPWM